MKQYLIALALVATHVPSPRRKKTGMRNSIKIRIQLKSLLKK
jgi:hypothetical protein